MKIHPENRILNATKIQECLLYLSVLGVFSLDRARKMLKNLVLDVEKLRGTAGNEPLQISDFDRSEVTYILG